jgi:transposase-like protein
MSINTRKSYDSEFKLEAVKLTTEGGYTLEQVAQSLGISTSVISKWKKRLLESGDLKMVFPGKGKLNPIDEERRKLHKEIRDLKIEKEILKKAMILC